MGQLHFSIDMQHKAIQVYSSDDIISLLAQYGSISIPNHHGFFLSGALSGSPQIISTLIGTVKGVTGANVPITIKIPGAQFEYFPLVLSDITSFTQTGSEGRYVNITFLR